jgi:hypothetical protein
MNLSLLYQVAIRVEEDFLHYNLHFPIINLE